MSYRLILESSAERDFRALDVSIARRVRDSLIRLQQTPRPQGSLKLRDVSPARYRMRVGDWRILYTIDESIQEVRVYRIRHCSQAY
jgi:mRNA interferase RelE/StbE